MMTQNTPPVCNYEGSEYQQQFWEEGGRAYEDAAEAIALKRLLPPEGDFMLELGAGAGRNTPRYKKFKRIALLDYSRTQLEQARARLGPSKQYCFIAANVYHLPFVNGLFDSATMIRTLHHMVEPSRALSEVRRVMVPNGVFILEFANKRNLKAMLRYLLGRQDWNPYSQEAIEFAALNFDFHPKAIRRVLQENEFKIEKQYSVSHFRIGFLKRHLPAELLAGLDSLIQWTGAFVQVSPSVFTRAKAPSHHQAATGNAIFQCPVCGTSLSGIEKDLLCGGCGQRWLYQDGIYDFRIDNA